jgi:hypothetical protein
MSLRLLMSTVTRMIPRMSQSLQISHPLRTPSRGNHNHNHNYKTTNTTTKTQTQTHKNTRARHKDRNDNRDDEGVPVTQHPHSSPCKGSKTTSSHPARSQSTGKREPARGCGARNPRRPLRGRDVMLVVRGGGDCGACWW